MAELPSVRARIPWLRLSALALVVVATLGNAALNVLPSHRPTARDLQRQEQAEMIAARRARLARLLADGDGCHPSIAHELARALVFDGRSARDYAADYERRCGPDPVIRHWAEAPIPR
jgi:hypothetical protein